MTKEIAEYLPTDPCPECEWEWAWFWPDGSKCCDECGETGLEPEKGNK